MVTNRVVDGEDDRLDVGADAEPVGALSVLNGDGCRHPEFGPDVAAAVRALVDEAWPLLPSPAPVAPARFGLLTASTSRPAGGLLDARSTAAQ
jgi:hypothetical protein